MQQTHTGKLLTKVPVKAKRTDLVEAAGIEPASEDPPHKASTCVAPAF